MQISHVTMDIESILNRIKRSHIKMDSEFQRGEVWSPTKKKKLIDTILREWPIPPVIFLKNPDGTFEILDGLQRITTIHQFVVENKIRIDGNITPENERINKINRMTFDDLKKSANIHVQHEELVNRIYSTPITIYEIQSAHPEEIAELFNRFNSPLALNTVEKRNAYFGETRSQIKELRNLFIEKGANKTTIGFSNNRGTYEDTLLKVCYTIQHQLTDKKISSDMLLESYRNEEAFDEEIIFEIGKSIDLFFQVNNGKGYNYSRATIYSILIFIFAIKPSANKLSEILDFVSQSSKQYSNTPLKIMYDEYTMYASTDVKSIKIRQYILKMLSNPDKNVITIVKEFKQIKQNQVAEIATNYNYIKDEVKQ